MHDENQITIEGRGGYRIGAGRPKGSKDRGARLTGRELAKRLERLQLSGAMGGTSSKVMHALGDAEYWITVITKLEEQEDWQTLTKVVMFHQQMRDGRPAQQINITSQSITYSADEIARARAVARELMGTNVPKLTIVNTSVDETPFVPSSPHVPQLGSGAGELTGGLNGGAESLRESFAGEDEAKHYASEDQGVKKDG